MAVVTGKRTQTNFDVNAVWQFFNMEERGTRVCRVCWWTGELLRARKARWKRGTARFGDAWILFDGDVAAVALVVARDAAAAPNNWLHILIDLIRVLDYFC